MRHPFDGINAAPQANPAGPETNQQPVRHTRRAILRTLFGVLGAALGLGAVLQANGGQLPVSTTAMGEEGGDTPARDAPPGKASTERLGEEGGQRFTTRVGEDGGRPITKADIAAEGGGPTTMANIPSEGGGPRPITKAAVQWENGGRPRPTTEALIPSETGGRPIANTMALIPSETGGRPKGW